MRVRVKEILEAALFRGKFAASDASLWDARVLLAHALGRANPLSLDPFEEVPGGSRQRFDELWGRRVAGVPVQHLVGEWDFYGRPFWIDDRALIPRPETEGVVATALEEAPEAVRILDCGTGGGIIAVTCLAERPRASLAALDISLAALALAKRNGERHRVAERLRLFASDWLSTVGPIRFDLALSNPPYLAASEAAKISPTVRDQEPDIALYSGADGLAAVRHLLDTLPPFLEGNAPFVFEIGFGQAACVEQEIRARPAWRFVRIAPDLAGIPRAAVARKAIEKIS